MNQNDSRRVIALLEHANPVELDNLVSQDDLDSARAEIQLLIAHAGPDAAAHATTMRARTDPPRATTTATRRRRSGARLAIVLATAACVAIVALSSGAGPATQSASAQTISKILRALQAPTGSILHIDFTATSSSPNGASTTWRQDTWTELNAARQQLTVDEHYPGTPAGTASTNNELYDPVTNTVFAPPQLPPAPADERYIPIPPARWPHMTPAQRRAADRSAARLNAEEYNAIRHPWMSQFVDQLKVQLANGQAHVDGHATIDGHHTIKITFTVFNHTNRITFARSSSVAYVAVGSYVPVKITEGTPTSPDGMTTYVFHTFKYLPAAANGNLFNLVAAHPTAKVDTSLAHYRAAEGRLFPNG
jgi:hypothetical protein